jgi:hypothetical protein
MTITGEKVHFGWNLFTAEMAFLAVAAGRFVQAIWRLV